MTDHARPPEGVETWTVAEMLRRWLERTEADRDAAVARAEQAEAERDEARKKLGECYRLSGADTDGGDWPHLWRRAVDAVRELRRDYDEALHEGELPGDVD